MTITEAPQVTAAPADTAPLSLNQEFLCAFDKGAEQGAFSDRHTLVYGWRVSGPIDLATLRRSLADVVERHEVLRTSIARDPADRSQRIHPPAAVPLRVRDLSAVAPSAWDLRAEELVNELDGGRYPVTQLPHLRAVLGRFTETDAVLVLVVHHTATDAWSMQITMRDIARCYAFRRGYLPDGPPVPQYREFTVAQAAALGQEPVARARAYWRSKLTGGQILALPTERPRADEVPNAFAIHRFLIDADLATASTRLAATLRCSPFMVLLAAYQVVLCERTGTRDIVVPTFSSGRYDERFVDTVGPFFNFLPLRCDLSGCGTFRDVVERTRTTCFEAYSHDIPFPLIVGEAPELVAPFADPGLAVFAFELLQPSDSIDGQTIGDLRYAEVRRRVLDQPVAADIPDGGLWALDILPTGEIAGSLKYDCNRYDASYAVAFADDLCRVVRTCVGAPDAPLAAL